ncbi:MAG: hypothetical protein MJZ37_07450 [Bacilli bacterium]|nr:hypothetical protein [Bacilli bacterium]
MVGVLFGVIIFLFIVVVILDLMLQDKSKKLSEAKTENLKLKSDLDWEKTKADVKKEIDDEVKKKSEKLNTGSKHSRISAAGDILCNKK